MRKIVPLLLLAAATFAVYAPALRNDFVWDDTALVLRDPLIRSWRLIPESFHHFLFLDATASDFYRPVQRISYTLDYAAHVFQPGGYHLTSVACHAAAAIALYFLALELLAYFSAAERARRFVPFFVALAGALHPLQSSAALTFPGRPIRWRRRSVSSASFSACAACGPRRCALELHARRRRVFSARQLEQGNRTDHAVFA